MKKLVGASIQILLSELLTLKVCLLAVGWIGRLLFGKRLSTIVLFYPANRRYMESVTFGWYARRVKWRPTFGGFFMTPDGGGLIFAMGAFEHEFADAENRRRLLSVHQRMGALARLTGIDAIAYSGVLPSVLAKSGIEREPIELARTAWWIMQAIDELFVEASLPAQCPIVILGSAGFLGRRVMRLLQDRPDLTVVEIDPEHPDDTCRDGSALRSLAGQPALIVNISRHHVMERYINDLWDGSVVLNEVYPECSPESIVALKARGVRYFHLQGVRAWSMPRFPGAYAGAVPCCAASAASPSSRNQAELKLLEK